MMDYVPNGECKFMAIVAILSAVGAIVVRLLFWD
jgi:hypothetical protein